MPRGFVRVSKSSAMAQWVIERTFATTAEVARQFACAHKAADNLLRQRARTVMDIKRDGDHWQATEKQQRTVAAVVAPRPFREWKGHADPGPIRPGAHDYERIPSLMAGARVPHHVINGQVTIESFGKRKVFSPS